MADETYQRNTPLPESGDFNSWSQKFQERQLQFPENENYVSLTFAGPVLINLMADLHVGHPSTDYGRIDQEVESIVSTANSYVILAGDLIDNMNWNPGQFQEMEQTPEQLSYMRALLEYLGSNGKILHSLGGDHDGWLKKAGVDLQTELPEKYQSSVSNGPTFFDMEVGEAKYRMAGAHQLPGHSMYSREHPQKRFERFGGARGADIVFSGHNHQKGHAEDYQDEWPGTPHLVHYIALGTYKQTDDWLSKKGFTRLKAREMFGSATYLKPGEKEVIYFEDIVEANEKIKHGKR